MKDILEMANTVCWNITNKCNEHCRFCYRDQTSIDLDFEDRKIVIDKVADAGIRKLTFAGGEPLMVSEIQELILYAKKKNLLVSMTTNGILLEGKLLNFCIHNLDWLTLSLDGATTEIQNRMSRNPNHVMQVKKILSIISQKNTKCKLKINSVISKVNKDYIEEIANLILKYPIVRWKLFQFVPLREASKKNKEEFFISDEEFYQTVEKAEAFLKEHKDIISVSDRLNIEKAYLVIFPNGDIKNSSGLQDRVLGNALLDDLKEIWNKEDFDKMRHELRTEFINRE